jgi:hypothetical protein
LVPILVLASVATPKPTRDQQPTFHPTANPMAPSTYLAQN